MCSWKYHRKHIFYLLFTFSQLSNKYIISFLNIETQKKQNPGKKFIKSNQYRNTKETKPRKKISSNSVKLREKGRERGDWVWSRGEIVQWMRRWDCVAEARSSGVGVDLCLIGAMLRSTRSVECGSLDWSSVWGVRCYGYRTGAQFEDWALSSSSLSLSLSLCLCAWVWKWFELKIFTSNHFWVKAIKTHGQLKIFSGKFIFHVQPNTCIYGKVFPKMIWSQNKHSLSLHEVTLSGDMFCERKRVSVFMDSYLFKVAKMGN